MLADATRRAAAGERISTEAACVKMFATEACGRIADRAVQIYGGAGYMAEYDVERFFRDVRVYRIYEGTTQIQQLVIAKAMLRELCSRQIGKSFFFKKGQRCYRPEKAAVRFSRNAATPSRKSGRIACLALARAFHREMCFQILVNTRQHQLPRQAQRRRAGGQTCGDFLRLAHQTRIGQHAVHHAPGRRLLRRHALGQQRHFQRPRQPDAPRQQMRRPAVRHQADPGESQQEKCAFRGQNDVAHERQAHAHPGRRAIHRRHQRNAPGFSLRPPAD